MYSLSIPISIAWFWVSASCRREMTFAAMALSFSASITSRMRKIRSNRDRIVVWKSMFSAAERRSSKLPKTGLAAARTEQREFNMVVIPALAMEIVCCSIASWIATRSSSFILSNSSMQTTPPSASTMAPPSRYHSPYRDR